MALQAGNRTFYNPTHGIEWRGNNLPFNTFYAVMCLFFFFFMAFVFRMCYKAYRNEIRLAERKQILAKQHNQRVRTAALSARIVPNGVPTGILKGDDVKFKEDDVSKSVQFAEKVEERFPDAGNTNDRNKTEGSVLDNGLISWHL